LSKTVLIKRLASIEQRVSSGSDKIVVLKMWYPGGKTTHSNNGRVRIEPTNPEDAEL
jgi:hypothetical protein